MGSRPAVPRDWARTVGSDSHAIGRGLANTAGAMLREQLPRVSRRRAGSSGWVSFSFEGTVAAATSLRWPPPPGVMRITDVTIQANTAPTVALTVNVLVSGSTAASVVLPASAHRVDSSVSVSVSVSDYVQVSSAASDAKDVTVTLVYEVSS